MNASTPTADALRLFDPQLIALLIELADNSQGDTALPWTQMGERLGRDPSNVTRSTKRMADTGLISLSPLTISDKARSILDAWNGEARPAAPADPAGATPAEGGEQAIPHNLIHASPLNPRKTFDAAELDELAGSIAEKGLLQNIVLRPHPEKPGEYEIAAGERRWRATGLLIQRGDLPADYGMRALVQPMSDKDLLLVALAENRDRKDPPPMEEARGIAAFRELRVGQVLSEIYKGDPIEKGFTEDQIKHERRLAEGVATKELAAAMGKTERWVQIRFNLVSNLDPELQTALSESRITLAQARAICTAPAEMQRNALSSMEYGYHGWSTADQIAKSLRQKGLPVSEARFDVADYSGPTMEDQETGETILLDTALVTTLSMGWIKRRCKELLAEGFAFVEILDDPYKRHQWHDAPAEAAPAECGALLWLECGRIHERRVEPKTSGPGAQPIKTTTETASGQVREEAIQPFAKRNWLAASLDLTARLRQGLADAGPQLAMALTIAGLIDRDMGVGYDAPGSWFQRPTRNSHDGEVPLFAVVAERIAALSPDGQPKGFKVKVPAVLVSNYAAAVDTLMEAEFDDVAAVFTALIAAQAGVWPGYNPGPGCDDFTRKLARRVDHLVPEFELTADYLAAFTLAQLRQIARACGIGAAAGDMPAKKAEAIAWIMEHTSRKPGWCPPEMTFGSPATIKKSVTAMLAGKGGAA